MKAVVFDFDGTLTEKHGNLWKKIWQTLGYEVGLGSYYMSLLNQFVDKTLTHSDWCKLTLKAYQDKGFNKQILDNLVDNIHLMQGAGELITHLHAQGIEIHIVSGNITSVIEKVLEQYLPYIADIKANEFVFDDNGWLLDIVGTKYDHEGKARYIQELCEHKGYKSSDIVFIGNSLNDEYVYLSGAKTICINPDQTDFNDTLVWNKVIETDNLMDLIKKI